MVAVWIWLLVAYAPFGAANAWVDHFFDFHINKEAICPEKHHENNDLGLTDAEWDRYCREDSRDSRDFDNGGRDFTPDRDK